MELTPLDQYFEEKPEPMKGFLLAITDILLNHDRDIALSWKWKTPFFTYKGKLFCYLSIQRKSQRPYLGFANGNDLKNDALLAEERKWIKVLYFDEREDVKLDFLNEILEEAKFLIDKKGK